MITDQKKVEIINEINFHFKDIVDDMIGTYTSIDGLVAEQEWSDEEVKFILNNLQCISIDIGEK